MKKIIAISLLALSAVGCSSVESTPVEKDDGVMTCMALDCVKNDAAQTEMQLESLMTDIAKHNMTLILDDGDVIVSVPSDELFDCYAKSELKDGAVEKIKPITDFAKGYAIEIEGHSDLDNDKFRVNDITDAQAQSVADVFDDLGFDVVSDGKSDSDAGSCNLDSPDCNKRVQIRISNVF